MIKMKIREFLKRYKIFILYRIHVLIGNYGVYHNRRFDCKSGVTQDKNSCPNGSTYSSRILMNYQETKLANVRSGNCSIFSEEITIKVLSCIAIK